MREGKRLVKLSEMEQGIVIRCLNDKRTALLQEERKIPMRFYSQPTIFEDFWHGLCQKYEFIGAILQVFMQNVCISTLKALLVTMNGEAVNSNTDAVDDILLKIMDAPIVKGRKERGAYAER